VSAQIQLLQQASVLSGRQMVMLIVIGLHALVISALMTMHLMPDISKAQTRITAVFLPRDPEPVPPRPELHVNVRKPPPVQLDMPLPDLNLTAPEPVKPPVKTGPKPNPAQATPGDADLDVVAPIAPTALQFRAVRNADDYYPSTSLSLQEEGASIVRVCVAPSGRLDGRPVIERSSGSSRLDAAALLWAREALRFTPATRDGVPISACKEFRVNFTLH
jgi:TonB family protein